MVRAGGEGLSTSWPGAVIAKAVRKAVVAATVDVAAKLEVTSETGRAGLIVVAIVGANGGRRCRLPNGLAILVQDGGATRRVVVAVREAAAVGNTPSLAAKASHASASEFTEGRHLLGKP